MIDERWETADGGKFIYGGSRVDNVRMDDDFEILRLTMVYAEHEWQIASYSGVCYNEIKERGAVIVMAEEYPLTAFKLPRFREARERFAHTREKPFTALFTELTEHEIKLFTHCVKGKEGEYIVLACRMEVRAKNNLQTKLSEGS